MGTQVTSERDAPEPIIRRKSLTARNDGGTRTVIDVGEYGRLVTDEPVPHGGTGDGPSPLQTVVAALCGCEAVTFSRTAAELGLAYRGIDFEAEFTIDIRGRLGNRSVRPTSTGFGFVPASRPTLVRRTCARSSRRPSDAARSSTC